MCSMSLGYGISVGRYLKCCPEVLAVSVEVNVEDQRMLC